MPEQQIGRVNNFARYSVGMLFGSVLTLGASVYLEDQSHPNRYEKISIESSTNNLKALEGNFTTAENTLFTAFRATYGRPDWQAGARAQREGANIAAVEQAYRSYRRVEDIHDDNEFEANVASLFRKTASGLGAAAALGFIFGDKRCAPGRLYVKRWLGAPVARFKMRTLRTHFADLEPEDIIYSPTSIEED